MSDLTRTVAVDVDETTPPPKRGFAWPWQVPAVFGAFGVALAGWVILAGITTVVWLGDVSADFGDALVLATKIFGLAHGAPADIAGQHVSLVPLGLSILFVFLALPVVGFAARQAVAQTAEGTDEVDVERILWTVAGIHTAVYAMSVAIACGAIVDGGTAARALIGALAVGAVAGFWGAAGALDHDPTRRWPAWLQVVPRALAVAASAVLVGGAVVVALAAHLGRDRIVAITEGLQPDGVGVLVLALLHLFYLPNFILWACSWLLGAGVTLGDGSLVSLLLTDVGLMPSIPVLGAVPEPGAPGMAGLWWLVVGVVAGALAGLAVAWARPRARFDETALVGGLSGVLAGLLLTLAASISSGGLGSERLAHVGARVDQLIIFAPVLLGLSGMLAGLILGLVRRPPAPPKDAEDDDQVPVADEDEQKEEA